MDRAHRRFAAAYFAQEIEPILTPLSVSDLKPTPLLPNLQLHVAALLVEEAQEAPPTCRPG